MQFSKNYNICQPIFAKIKAPQWYALKVIDAYFFYQKERRAEQVCNDPQLVSDENIPVNSKT
ncbi:hypothetical protein [Ferruginibacter sp.]|nr:hypothetical protein [Ferruginibacter sp.]